MSVALRFLVAFLALTLAVGHAADLSYSFVPGSTAEYSAVVNAVQIMSREGGDLPETASYTQTYGIAHRVVSQPAPGQGRVETTFKSVNASVQAGGVTTTYNSVTTATPPAPFIPLGALIGQSYTTDLSTKGHVLAVSGLAELQQRLLDADPSTPLKVDYDLNALLDEITNTGTLQLPAGDVLPGASWVSTLTLPTPFTGTMVVAATFTYMSDEQVQGLNTAQVAFELSARTLDEPAASKAWTVGTSQIETRNTVSLTGSGSYNLAIAEGLLVKMNWTGRLISSGTSAMLGSAGTETQQTTSDVMITQNLDLTGRS